MEDEDFHSYLKKGGRKPNVIQRVFRLVTDYEHFLAEERELTEIDLATAGDLEAYVAFVERIPKRSAKTHLWAIRYYYQYSTNENMAKHAALLREERIVRKPFSLREFRGVIPEHINALAAVGIKDVQQMREAGLTSDRRDELAQQTGVPLANIVELVRLSDLARIPGIKGIRARLYHDAGIDSIEKLAQSNSEELLEITTKFVKDTGFDGIAPLPGEVKFSIEKAKQLPKVVKYD